MTSLCIILFCSRNKDNKDVPDFKERRMSFVTNNPTDLKVFKAYEYFVEAGVPTEVSRFYKSVNYYDSKLVQKSLQHHLLDNNVDMTKIDSVIASLTAKTKPISKSWLFDYDGDMSKFGEFRREVNTLAGAYYGHSFKTVTGGGVVVHRGFDTRELLAKWPEVELKRTDSIELVTYKRKGFDF